MAGAVAATVIEVPGEEGTSTLEVVLVDRDPALCQGLEMLLDHTSGGQVRLTGHTQDARRAADLVRRRRPHVAVVSLETAPAGGAGLIAELKRARPGVRVLALCGNDAGAPLSAFRAGADGVLFRTCDPESLVAPLLSLASGWAVLPREVLRDIVEAPTRGDSECLGRLDDEERRLWRLVAEGADTAEICARFHLSQRTAKRKVAQLLGRLRVHSRVQAAALAGRCGLLDQPEH